jgi:hypothetical protein
MPVAPPPISHSSRGEKATQAKASEAAAPGAPQSTTKKKSRKKRGRKQADKAQEAIDLVTETMDALHSERGDRAKLWGSMIKQTLKRRRPGFNESYYGFGSFSDLLEEAEKRGALALELDEKSGGYVVRALREDG